MSEKYNDGVLDEKFKSIEDKMDTYFEAHTNILRDIKDQTTKTNGRVTLLEKMMWTSLGALPLLTVWSGWMTHDILKSKEEVSPVMEAVIESAVLNALQHYDINPH